MPIGGVDNNDKNEESGYMAEAELTNVTRGQEWREISKKIIKSRKVWKIGEYPVGKISDWYTK